MPDAYGGPHLDGGPHDHHGPHDHDGLHGHGAGDVLMRNARAYDLMLWVWGRRGRRWRTGLLDAVGLAAGERALDVAAGTGELALEMARRVGAGGAVVGVDGAPEMISRAVDKAARRGTPVTFRQALAQRLPFGDASFDVVTCTLAMHHVARGERGEAVAEMRRVLAPGGRLLIADLESPVGRGGWLARHRFAHHLAERPLDEAQELVGAAGFDQIRRAGTRTRWIGQLTAVR